MLKEYAFDAAGAALHVAEGPGSGPPLVLLHGVARRWQDYLPLIPALAVRWHLFALDFRGHGRSARRPGAYRVVDYVDDAAALVTRVAAEPVVVYGHSLGAMVAAAVAARHPAQVRAVVLEDPPFDTLGSRIGQTAYPSMFAAYQELAGRGLAVAPLAAALGNVTLATPGKTQRLKLRDLRDASALRFMASCLARLDPETMAPLVAGRWLDGYDQASVLAGVRCPSLLLQGEYSLGGMLDDAQAAEVAAALADCTHVRFPGCGHLIHSQQAEAALRVVTAFLESL